MKVATDPTYTSRDSATSRLRKAGVDKSQYNKYIILDNGTYTVLLGQLAKDQAPKSTAAKKPKTGAAKAPRAQQDSLSGFIRAGITSGKTNDEIWRSACAKFPHLTDKQKHYPAWYRSEMKRRGLIQED